MFLRNPGRETGVHFRWDCFKSRLFGSFEAGSTNAGRQPAHQRFNARHGVLRRLPVLGEAQRNLVDDGRADDNAIGRCTDEAGMFGRLDAEADADRKFGVPLDAGNSAGNQRGSGRAEPVMPFIET